ncbi:myosin-6-like [Mytilus trossulus]|uniref:myosin-6-like n=1 Tax=Mytilus trossulus TaxID=6551 RepID=UPI0030074BAE
MLMLALNNEEQASLGKECEDLKILLQQKQKELNNLKSRFQELADSKETSEVLHKIIENLQREKSDLNQRLEINNDEKSSILKENKELKNILQEKLSEVKRLETRLQQYAEKFEDIPALKRHMDKLQSDNDELNLKCRHLQTVEKDVQKLKKEKQQLETEIISQKQHNETLNSRLEILSVEKLEIEDRLRRRSPQVVSESKSCQNCFKHRNDISDLKREINDLRDRLSEAAGNKLRDNNPNIADLSDMNRPTSLAEKFSSLYTDEYTDAMEVIEDDMDEAASVKVMLDWLKSCYAWCQRLAKEQRDTLINRSIGFMEDHGGQKVILSDRCLIFVKEFQKKIAAESLAVVGQICHVKSVTQQTLSSENYIVKYIKKCSELCWMMQISDPPLFLNFDVNSGENLNKNDYNVFTKSGSKIDYLVWPVLYLHKTGPMLAKGVAQGK